MAEANFLIQREPWMELASCKNEDPDLFVLEQGYTAAEAIKFCKVCSVRQLCEDYAIRTHSVGVWGGKLFSIRFSEAQDLFPMVSVQNFSITSVEPGSVPSLLEALGNGSAVNKPDEKSSLPGADSA